MSGLSHPLRRHSDYQTCVCEQAQPRGLRHYVRDNTWKLRPGLTKDRLEDGVHVCSFSRCEMNILPVALTLILPIGISLAQQPAQPQSGAGAPQSSQAQSKGTSSSASGGETASFTKTQKYKGTLVDATCARTGAASSPAGRSSADRTASGSATPSESGGKGGANRQATAANSCPATANTTNFALQLNDGRTLQFDSVGSERVKEGLKSKKKWADAVASGKPIHSTVHGVESGDRLMALSID